MIKAVTFDLDGVYFTPESFRNFKKNLPKKVTGEEKVNWVLYKSPEILAFKSGKMSENAFWAFAKSQLGINMENAGIFKVLRDNYEVNPEVHEYVIKIRKTGLKTCICSNNFVTRVRELNNKFDFLKHFDVKVFSFEEGVLKPEKAIFRKLIKRSGVKPDEIVYSDDDVSKLQGARDLGINTFVYEGFDKFALKLTELGIKLD